RRRARRRRRPPRRGRRDPPGPRRDGHRSRGPGRRRHRGPARPQRDEPRPHEAGDRARRARRRHPRTYPRGRPRGRCRADPGPVHRPHREGGPPMSRVATSRRNGATTRPQWARTALRHLQIHGYMWMWFWAICVVGIAVATVVTDRIGTVNVSIVQFVRNGPLVWFLLSIAILVATAYLGPHVANGMTRRSFTVGALGSGVALSPFPS